MFDKVTLAKWEKELDNWNKASLVYVDYVDDKKNPIPSSGKSILNGICLPKLRKAIKGQAVKSYNLKLDMREGANAYVTFQEDSYEVYVDGSAALVGNVMFRDGTTMVVFHRWISKPFWQVGNRRSK